MPTILRSGDALNVVPAAGELVFDIRADRLEALRDVLNLIPEQQDGAAIEAVHAARVAGHGRARKRQAGAGRGGTSAWAVRSSQRSAAEPPTQVTSRPAGIAVTIDGLGPRGGHAHAPDEFVDLTSLLPRAEVALAVADTLLQHLSV